MSLAERRKRLVRDLAQARRRYLRQDDEERGDRPLPGNLYAFPEDAALVQWAVIEESSDGTARLLMIPADDHPLLGSADVEVAAPGLGAFVLRCRHEVWIAATRLEPGRRTGHLEGEVLEEVRRRRAEIASGRPVASALARETDFEPEYQDWMEELEAARAALAESPQAMAAPRTEEIGKVVRFPSRWQAWGPLASLAASIFLVVSLGLFGTLVFKEQRIDDLEEQLRELEAMAAESWVNPPMALLLPRGQVRAEVTVLTVPAEGDIYQLVLEPADRSYARYRLDVLTERGASPIWSRDDLSVMPGIDITVVMLRNALPSGDYLLRFYGLTGSQEDFLQEHALRLEVHER